MARAIDASELIVEIQVCSWDSEQDKERAEDLVLGMPTLTPPNEPLTLEELREMYEVPVWIQNLEEPAKSLWRLLYWDRGKYLVLQGISVRGYLMEEYGESWLAYRRPPEGEEGDVNRG